MLSDTAHTCLTEDEVVAWIHGTASSAVEARLRAHLDVCDVCFEVVGIAHTQTNVAPPPALERYVVVAELGRGGMGVVYRGRDQVLERDVAIKVVQTGSSGTDAHAGLLDESRIMAKLRHENIVAVHDVVVDSGSVHVVMEFVEGSTLRRWVERERPSWNTLLSMLDGVGRGLHAAHRRGVVHGDLKPDNVLVSHSGRPQLTDFGLSSLGSSRRANRYVAGTPAYMAPEQRRGVAADARSDQYALCVSIWELIRGSRPRGVDLVSPAAARAALPHLPPAVVAALLRGLCDDPARRHRDVAALMRALRPPPMRWGIAVLWAAPLLAVAALAAPGESPSCTTPPFVQPDWDRVEARLVARDGPRGHLVVNDIRNAVTQTHDAMQTARSQLCTAARGRSYSHSGQTLIATCLASVEAQHAAALQLLDEGTLDVAGDFHRQSVAAAGCGELPQVPGAVALDVDRLRDNGLLEEFAAMRVLGAVSDARARPIAERLLQASDDRRLRAAAYTAGAYGLYWSDPTASRRWFARAQQTAVELGDPILELDALLGVLSTEQMLGGPSVTAGLVTARRAVKALPATGQRAVLAARIEGLATVSSISEGRGDDARRHMQALRNLQVDDPYIQGLAFETDVLTSQLEGDLDTAIERQRALLHWQETRGITPSRELVATLIELSVLTRARGDVASTLAALQRAGSITADAQVPPAVVRQYTLQHASVLAELGETERAQSLLANDSHLDPALAKARLDVLRFADRSAEAVEDPELHAALERSPFAFSIPLAVALARAYVRADQPQLAHAVLASRARWFTRHYPRLPDTREARLALGWALHDMGRYDEADLEFQAVRASPPNAWAEAWAQLGSASAARARGRPFARTVLAEAVAALHEAPPGWAFERRRADAVASSSGLP